MRGDNQLSHTAIRSKDEGGWMEVKKGKNRKARIKRKLKEDRGVCSDGCGGVEGA